MGWIISLLFTIAPRIILLILWLFTPLVSHGLSKLDDAVAWVYRACRLRRWRT